MSICFVQSYRPSSSSVRWHKAKVRARTHRSNTTLINVTQTCDSYVFVLMLLVLWRCRHSTDISVRERKSPLHIHSLANLLLLFAFVEHSHGEDQSLSSLVLEVTVLSFVFVYSTAINASNTPLHLLFVTSSHIFSCLSLLQARTMKRNECGSRRRVKIVWFLRGASHKYRYRLLFDRSDDDDDDDDDDASQNKHKHHKRPCSRSERTCLWPIPFSSLNR